MKKILVCLLLILITFSFATAQTPKGKIEIEFWHSFSGALGDKLITLVNKFNSSQDKYYINAIYKGSYQESMSAAIAAFRAGKAPHIVQIFEVGTATMIAAKNAIYPVHQLFKDVGLSLNSHIYLPAVRSYYSFSTGQMAAMPFNSSTAVLWYNKDVFRKAGLNPENPPKTWEEVKKTALLIKNKGASKIALTTSWFSWTQLEQFGAIHNIPFATRANGFLGLDAQLSLNHPLFVKHMQNLVDWQREGIFTYGGRDSQPDSLFISGDAAMFIGSSATYASIKRDAKFDWGMTYLPYYDDFIKKPWNSIIGGAALWVMRRPDTTKEQYKGVAEFFKFLAKPENDAWWHINTGYVPVTLEGYKYAKSQGFYKKNPYMEIPILQLTRTNPSANTRGLRLGNLPAIRIVIYEEMEKAFQNQQSVKEAINNILIRGNKILREFEAIYGK
uniref:sn-glycerol-3-phosphate-binding periplasmic protein UgpB n=1 Tax=Dictyoglomus thermophilum TaxID=14 RepID=A0A7C3MQJ1_DICTH